MSNYTPIFPYKGAQIILTSDRVVVHSEQDAIFLFGKKAVGLSSVGRVNIDTKEGVTINAPEIELGLSAKEVGEPVAKADTTIAVLRTLIGSLKRVAVALQGYGTDGSIPAIVSTAKVLEGACDIASSSLENIKSKVTSTR